MEKILEQQISAAISMGFISIDVNVHIKDNLNSKFKLRPYQLEAFARFDYYFKRYPKKLKPTQLLFHMATGSGKTLIMAGIILDLYKAGYRNFIFFVNSSNIIEKTRDNFLNKASSKFLFNENITFEDKKIEIKEVENFEAANQNDINIVFTTIQGLHTRLNTPKENSLTYEDFENKKIVLLSDEAHHINSETKKGKQTKVEVENINSWESTVNHIFKANPNNVLLEFTATADLANKTIKQKYQDKLIFDYPLKQFRKDKYSKDVQVLQAALNPFERALQAIILNQYRRKIFEANGLNIKPVILFKSKTIKDSDAFYKEFTQKLKTLSTDAIQNIRNSNRNMIIQKIFDYLDNKKITLDNFLIELKEDFSEDKCVVVNSKNDSYEKQLIINSLEDESNEYRAIFAVDKLNEGWDVLNLFDIVRLYNTRDTNHKSGKVGKTTMSEAQLIGRGARYFPFKISSEEPLYQRKYDEDIENDLRICEELFYHSAHNPKYISELNKALEQIGIKSQKSVQIKLELKESFKASNFYKKGFIYINKQIKNNRLDITALDKSIIDKIYKKRFLTGYTRVSNAFQTNVQLNRQNTTKIHYINSFDVSIIRKALNKLPFYRFNNLQKYFPHLSSITEFIISDKYLNKIQVEVEGNSSQVHLPTNQMKLATSIAVLNEISTLIPKGTVSYKGTKVFKAQSISKIFTDKTINIAVNEASDKEVGIGQSKTSNQDLLIDLSKEDWFVFNDNFGTAEEKYLVKYIKQAYTSLKNKFEDIYLIRNERHFKLYTFDEGRAIEPDFVLFLNEKNVEQPTIYQLFIEPKGQHLIATDQWKEDFLKQLGQEHELLPIFENKTFKLLGMPFYNEAKKKTTFDKTLKSIINI